MIKDVIESLRSAAGKLFSNWGASLISILLYATLLAALYLFFTTREATMMQVALSLFILPLAAILSFFLLQAMGLSYVRIGVGPVYLFKRALRDCWKLMLVTIPLIVLAGVAIYLIGSADSKLMSGSANSRLWMGRILGYVRLIFLYFILPLLAIHFWISAVREGVGRSIKNIGRTIVQSFSLRSILTYLIPVVVFGLLAYALFFIKTPVKGEWMELWLFGARIALALVAIFLGWLITLGAMAEMTAQQTMNETR